ncbi:hypothetical protein LSH36_426g02002 [Paralvinella palmiformis]|uniref:G-protein coupled receptors family 1 profile domain-containing protein n=1 Tax=Paralvinella palmiformis TaxID=53620 RepID=A0AAD9MYE4_9ANNE|nr:hypothetical protein LSH36_426g02002 [Paralvinella palmiformis]
MEYPEWTSSYLNYPVYDNTDSETRETLSSYRLHSDSNLTSTNITDESVNSPAVTVLKSLVFVTIMVSAVFGNLLVIISVFRFEKLKIIANSFIVSLAFADLLVALLVMPFNASMEIAGRWVFGRIMCDIFNANDVLFSTASLLHLCCISMDRYIAITDPFQYELRMTRKRVALMLSCAWGASSLISHVPIHLGWYTTPEQRYMLQNNEDQCTFIVNRIYGIISSTISFWTPTFIMVFTYVKIFKEARRQERQIYKQIQTTRSSKIGNGVSPRNRNGSCQSDTSQLTNERKKLKKEHKAAKTLGIIMGAFLFCWLPFIIWYGSTTMCGEERCPTPAIVVSFLFWLGYTNSALNPVIYAFFNRDFRNAFKRLLGCNKIRCSCSMFRSRCCSRDTNRSTLSRKDFTELPCRAVTNSSRSSTSSSPRRPSLSKKSYEAVHITEPH